MGGVFKEGMPASIERKVDQRNLEFMNLRDIMNDEYTCFILRLLDLQPGYVNDERAVKALELGCNYMFNTYLHCHKNFRPLVGEVQDKIKSLFIVSRPCCEWFIGTASSHERWIPEYLLDCPLPEVRGTFARLLAESLVSYFEHDVRTQ